MSLKINGSIINMIKINGCYIKQAKLNRSIVYELKSEETQSSTMATEWLDYNNPNFQGSSRLRDSLDAWIYNNGGNTINGVYLDLVAAKPCKFKMTAKYHSYAGAPTKYCVFVLDSNNNDAIVTGYNYKFDSNGTETTRELTIDLKRGNYKVVIGSNRGFEFGVKIKQTSLKELQSN